MTRQNILYVPETDSVFMARLLPEILEDIQGYAYPGNWDSNTGLAKICTQTYN